MVYEAHIIKDRRRDRGRRVACVEETREEGWRMKEREGKKRRSRRRGGEGVRVSVG